MHLRHLIVLIIDVRNRRAPLARLACPRTRTKLVPHHCWRGFDRSDQINQNSRAVAVSLRGTDQTSSEASLYDVERSGRFASEDAGAAKLALCVRRYSTAGIGGADRDRTDDLKLAKLPLSQLSYGPIPSVDGGPWPAPPAADAIGEDAQNGYLYSGPPRTK